MINSLDNNIDQSIMFDSWNDTVEFHQKFDDIVRCNLRVMKDKCRQVLLILHEHINHILPFG